MPAPITHIAHAQQYLQIRPELDPATCWRGTIFPDVRYLAGLERSQTHQPGEVTLEMIHRETNSWMVGYLLHNWVDDAWNAFMGQFELVFGEPGHELTWATLKLLEDRSVRAMLVSPEVVAQDLIAADPEIHQYGVSNEIAIRWGGFIATEIRNGWMSDSWDVFAADGLRLPATAREAVRRHMTELESQPVWQSRLQACWKELNRQLRS